MCSCMEMQDSYGDDWNGALVTVYRDGEAVTDLTCEGAESSAIICTPSGSFLELRYTAGQYEQENSFNLFDYLGDVLVSEGPTPTEGRFFSATPSGHIDCNDSNQAIHPEALDPCDHIENNCEGLDADGPLS